MKKTVKEKGVRTVPIWMGILVFALAFGAGVASKFAIQPGWAKEYSVTWSDELGTRMVELSYGDGEANEIRDDSYLEKMNPISAAEWITPEAPPTVVAYGTHDRVQPFKASLRLKAALEENGVDFKYFEMPHSGHGLQNDHALYRQWMEAVEDYLDKYMPVN